MRLWLEDGTPMLLNRLISIRDERAQWRCLHIRLSRLPTRKIGRARPHFILETIKERLAEHDALVYGCNDGDLMILFKGRITPIINALSPAFADLSESLERPRTDSPFALHDMAKDWLHLFIAVKRKIERAEHRDLAMQEA